jgi:hypothetical protein
MPPMEPVRYRRAIITHQRDDGSSQTHRFTGEKFMLCKKALLPIILLALCLCGGPLASADNLSFTVHFAGCTEFAGWGPVSLAEAQPLVPAGYMIAGAATGQAAIVVRATSCQGVAIGQSAARPTEISQIGINLIAPDGTGDINNYTVIYVTNNPALAEYFQIAGLPAVFDPKLTYEYTPTEVGGNSGELYVTASGQGLRPIFSSEPKTTRRPIPSKVSWRTGGSPAVEPE